MNERLIGGDFILYQCERCKKFTPIINIEQSMDLCDRCLESFKHWYNEKNEDVNMWSDLAKAAELEHELRKAQASE